MNSQASMYKKQSREILCNYVSFLYSLNTFSDETLYIKMTCEVIQVEIEIRKWTEFTSFHDMNNNIFLFDTQIKVQGTVVNLFDILFVVK